MLSQGAKPWLLQRKSASSQPFSGTDLQGRSTAIIATLQLTCQDILKHIVKAVTTADINPLLPEGFFFAKFRDIT